METLHAILGLTPAATTEEVTRAYRKLVRRYPPELVPEQFARIHRAYQLLTSLEHRIEAAESSPEETLEQLFAPPALKPPPPPPPPLTGEDLESLRAPHRRALLARCLRDGFAR